MMNMQPPLDIRSMIEKHLQTSGLAVTKFGELAVGDPNLVRNVREGRELRRATAARVIEFMLTGRTHEDAKREGADQ